MRNEFILRASAEDRHNAPENPAQSAVPRPPAADETRQEADETRQENEVLTNAGWRPPVKDSGQRGKGDG